MQFLQQRQTKQDKKKSNRKRGDREGEEEKNWRTFINGLCKNE